MSEVVYQWHPHVVVDFRELDEDLRAAYLEQIEAIKSDPKVGEHLDRRASTGDLSAYRKLKFGRDTPRGPSHRIVYQLLPDSYTPSRFRVIAVRSRADVHGGHGDTEAGLHPDGGAQVDLLGDPRTVHGWGDA